MPPKERYGYTVARLRALENRLLDEAFLSRLIESDSLEAAVKALGETSYAPWLMDMKAPSDFDRAIESELIHCYNEVATFTPDAPLVALCRLLYDVHNVKVLVKSVILRSQGGKSRFDLLSHLGNIDTDQLVLAVEGEEYWELPYGFAEAIPQALEAWSQNHDALEVEKILDHVYLQNLLKTAQDLKMDLVTQWVRLRIDGENVKTLLRLSRIDMDRRFLATYLHDGGTLAVSSLVSMASEPVENWARAIGHADISTLLVPFQTEGDFNSQLIQFEKDLDNFVSDRISESRYGTFEPANVARYLWAKEMEAKNLRVVLVSISNGVEKDAIRGLLRHVG